MPDQKTPLGYHDVKVGMTFQEVGGQNRTLHIIEARIYHVYGEWTSARGLKRRIQVPRKQITNPERWTLVEKADARQNG